MYLGNLKLPLPNQSAGFCAAGTNGFCAKENLLNLENKFEVIILVDIQEI